MNDVVSIASLIGVSSIIGAFINSRLSRTNELEFKIREQKLTRYKVILLFMDAYLTPENMKYLNNNRAPFQHEDKRDVVESLKSEYREVLLYGSREVVTTIKQFIDKPSEQSFIAATLAMRRDLGKHRKDLETTEVSL